MSPKATTLIKDGVGSYLQDIGRVPLLTPEQEIKLSKQVQQMMSLLAAKEALTKKLRREPTLAEWAAQLGLEEYKINTILRQGHLAKQKMVAANLRLVVVIAKKYTQRNMELLDLIQEGSIGLIRGIEKFDPEKGFRLSTYTYYWVMQAITRAIALQSRTICLPVHITEKLNKIKKAQRSLSQKLGRAPTITEIASESKLKPAKVRECLEQSRLPVSLDTLVGSEQDTTLGELLDDSSVVDAAEDYVMYELMRQDIKQQMQNLTSQEQQVLSLRFGLDNGVDLPRSQVGKSLRLSKERIRQIENKGLEKLRFSSSIIEGYQY